MHVTTAILTAATLAIHAALGCCWHHGHTHAATCGAAAVPEQVCSHGHRHGHNADGHRHDSGPPHEDHPQENAPPGDGPCGQCDQGACVFLAGGKPVTPDHAAATSLPGIVSLPAVTTATSPAVVGTEHIPHALPPPLRSHLAKRVLLI